MSKRIDELLKRGAEDLNNGISFPSSAFLQNNAVTLDEAYTLTNRTAAILRGFLALPKEIQNAVLLLGVSDGELSWEAVYYAAKSQRLRILTKQISEVK